MTPNNRLKLTARLLWQDRLQTRRSLSGCWANARGIELTGGALIETALQGSRHNSLSEVEIPPATVETA